MNYRVTLKKKAEKELAQLPKNSCLRIAQIIDRLSENPRPPGTKKLYSKKNWWRIRAGDYRILYEIDDSEELITIFRIGHRKDVYRFWD